MVVDQKCFTNPKTTQRFSFGNHVLYPLNFLRVPPSAAPPVIIDYMVEYKKAKSLSKTEVAYLAGIIDGEGTITLTRRNIYKNRLLVLTISNNELPLLEYIVKITGVGKITRKNIRSENHSLGYTYQTASRQALDLIRSIYPFLRTYKKRRAALVLKHYLKLTPRNGKYSPTLLRKREKFAEKFLATVP